MVRMDYLQRLGVTALWLSPPPEDGSDCCGAGSGASGAPRAAEADEEAIALRDRLPLLP